MVTGIIAIKARQKSLKNMQKQIDFEKSARRLYSISRLSKDLLI